MRRSAGLCGPLPVTGAVGRKRCLTKQRKEIHNTWLSRWQESSLPHDLGPPYCVSICLPPAGTRCLSTCVLPHAAFSTHHAPLNCAWLSLSHSSSLGDHLSKKLPPPARWETATMHLSLSKGGRQSSPTDVKFLR